MANNASIKWIQLFNAVLATIGKDFTPIQDRQTYAVMSRAIRELMAKKTIAEPLKSKVIQNIAIRVGPREFAFDGDIALTKNQRQYARNHGWANFPTYNDRYGSQPVTELEIPTFDDADEDAALIMQAMQNPELKKAMADWLRGQVETPAPHQAEVVEFPTPTKPNHHADALTIWVKEREGQLRASGAMDIGGQKFCLNFMDFFSALDRVPASENNASWRALMAGEVADAVLPVERKSTGVAARSTMSAIHSAKDSFGRQMGVLEQTVIVLAWDGDQPVAAMIFDGDEETHIEIKRESGNRFKGYIRMAA